MIVICYDMIQGPCLIRAPSVFNVGQQSMLVLHVKKKLVRHFQFSSKVLKFESQVSFFTLVTNL